MALSPNAIPKIYGDVPPFMAAEHACDLAGREVDAVCCLAALKCGKVRSWDRDGW